jgi:phosphoribosylformylglycinamidine (FGAM) synthase PurS component
MPQRIEITLKEQLLDAEGQSLCHKAKDYFDIDLHQVRTINIVTIDADLTRRSG